MYFTMTTFYYTAHRKYSEVGAPVLEKLCYETYTLNSFNILSELTLMYLL